MERKTKYDTKQIAWFYHEGRLSISEICKLLSCCYSTARRHLEKDGRPLRSPTETTLLSIMKGKKWKSSPEIVARNEEIYRLWKKGERPWVLARAVGLTNKSVRDIITRKQKEERDGQ